MSTRPSFDFRDLEAVDAELLDYTIRRGSPYRHLKAELKELLPPELYEKVKELSAMRADVQWACGARCALKYTRDSRYNTPAPPPPPPPPPLPDPAPETPYRPPERRRPVKADELPTDAPSHVQAVARRVEEHVRRFPGGQCQKGDVIAAFPTDRKYLPDAFKHLHLSKRVQVTGRTLVAL